MRASFLPVELAFILNRYCADQRTTKIGCYFCEEEFGELLVSHNIKFNFVFSKIILNKYENYVHGIYEVGFSDTKNKKETSRLGIFHYVQYGDELYLISGEGGDFFQSVLLKSIRSLYPHIQSAFIHSDGIFKILDHFEKIKDVKLGIRKVIRKQIFGEEPRTEIAYETYKENREYPSFREAFLTAREYDLWIDKIKLFTQTGNTQIQFQFSISRRGEVSFDKGIFDNYFPYILVPIMEFSKERRKQFQGRSRSEHADKMPRPLVVKFGKDVFEEDEVRQQFIELLNKYTNCNYSVIHNGNPHIYVSILDRVDRSSFAVRTLGSENLLLIPQVKTSALSLMRFSEFLVTSFYEGTIENYESKKE